MISGDFINGCFECIGGLLTFLSCFRLYKDKEVKGVSLVPLLFFTMWGFWNLYYYPSLDQWMSFVGGLIIVLANTIWISLAVYYTVQNRKIKKNANT